MVACSGCPGADGSGGARDTHYLGQGDTLDPAFILEMKAWMMFNVTRRDAAMVDEEEDEEEDEKEDMFQDLVAAFHNRADDDLDDIKA